MSIAKAVLRIARPTDRLQEIAALYCRGLGFEKLGEFVDHQGFDGIMIGHPQHAYHLEFTQHRGVRVGQAPTQDHLLVFYLPDENAWRAACERMRAAGFLAVTAYNPYWDRAGQTFEDPDGYRMVLQHQAWQG
ncbi:TPA: VOC family protein [Serratia marcescens]|nr:VOC family protein [Serratia marcescens]